MIPLRVVPSFAVLVLAAGCQVFEGKQAVATDPTAPASTPAATVRGNTYSLLFDLLDQEKDLDKLSIIKKETPQLHDLIKAISTTSAAGAKTLEQVAKQDASLQLKNIGLPAGEVSTRAAISRTETKELLLTSGQEFELNLLVTQASALSYGWHLAAVAAKNEPAAERSQFLSQLSADLKKLHHDVVSLIALRRLQAPSPSAK